MAEFPRWRTKLNDFLIFWEHLRKNKGQTDLLRESDILYGICEKPL